MYKSKLVQILKKLTPVEQHSLQQFLESPFFNQRRDVIKLAGSILNGLKKGPSHLDKRQIWARVYEGSLYQDQRMRLLMSYLHKLVEQFLSVASFVEDRQAQDLRLLWFYRDRDLEKPFRRVQKRSEEFLQQEDRQDQGALQAWYELKYEQHLFQENKSANHSLTLNEMDDLLDQQFIYQKLRQSCIFYARNAILDESHQPNFLDYILSYLEAEPERLEPIGIHLYYQLYQLLRSKEEASPEPLLSWLRPHFKNFSSSEMKHVFQMLINYCIRQMNAGKTLFIQRTFDLYKEGIEKRFLFEKGFITDFTYINIMFSGLKLKAFEWVEIFLDEYRSFLKAGERDNIYYFCLAHLRYEQERLTEAMKLLVRFGAKQDFFLYLSAQTTLVKIYFQLEEYEPLDSLLQRMQVYINRKTNMGYRKAPYKKLISVCRKMIQLAPGDSERKKQLQLEAGQIAIPSFRQWLLEQLEAK